MGSMEIMGKPVGPQLIGNQLMPALMESFGSPVNSHSSWTVQGLIGKLFYASLFNNT